MKKILTFLIAIAISSLTFGQLTGVKTIPGDYASLTLAITDLNTSGVGAGGVTLNVAAGYTETFASPTAGLITATGTATDPIVFQKSGVGTNPLITAGVGTSTTVDGIIVIAGGDYITFDGIDLQENILNITSTTQMEWGYALVKVDGTNGSQYNIIKNCTITLNKADTYSTCIYSGNHTSVITTALTVTNISGANSNNKFFGNNLSNCYRGIYLSGFIDVTSPYVYYDQNNEIGVTSGNSISNYAGSTFATNAIYADYQNNVKIANNTITGGSANTGTLYGIYTGVGLNANGEIYSNNISLTPTGTSSTVTCIGNNMGGTGTTNTFSIHDNTIENINWSTSTSGTFYGIRNYVSAGANPLNMNIYNNIIRNNTFSGTGTMNLIYTGASAGTNNFSVYSNNIYGNQKSGASGTLNCIVGSTATISIHDNNIYNNTISSTSGTSAAIIYGYYNYGSPLSEAVYNNTIYGLSVGGTTTSTASLVRGIYTNTTTAAVKNVYSNQIYNLSISSTGGGTIDGIYQATGTTMNIYKNNIYNMSASAIGGIVNGIYISSGTTNNVYNNFISDLKTPAATGTNAINGIYLSGGTTDNVYYNTIYLNASSSSATTFGTSGIYASTTPTVDLRNNIVVNTSTPIGVTGFTAAYRRSGITLTSYAAISNSNDFYAGTPGVNNLIYYDGTNSDQTIVAYQTRVAPRETVSFSALPPFVNSATTPYDLHLQTTIATMCESGGTRITSPAITDDFDGDIRWGETGYIGTGSTTDVGADEFNGIPSYTCSAPTPGNTIASSTIICNGQSIALSLQNVTIGTGVSYQWQSSANGVTYANIIGATSATYNVIPLAATYYQCIVTCQNGPATATSTPVQVTFSNSITSTTPGSRCGTGSVALAATGSAGATLNWYDAITGGTNVGTGSPFNTPSISSTTTYYVAAEIPQTGVIIGAGASTSTGYESPFYHSYGGKKSQYLILASELTAAGLTAGNINSLSIEVIATGTTYSTFNLSMGTTSVTALTSTFETGLTSVFSTPSISLTSGINTITFSTPLTWDGTSNIIIESCWSNNNTGGTSATVKYDATSFVSESYYRADSQTPATLCGTATATSTMSARPKFYLNYSPMCSSPRTAIVATIGASPILTLTADQTVCNNSVATLTVTSTLADYDSYVWTPITDLFTDVAATTPYVAGASATTVYVKSATPGAVTYTCTSNNSSTICANVATSVVTTLPVSPVITPSPASLCLSGISAITASPATGYGTATFQWQNSTDNVTFVDISSANSIDYTTPNITSTTYYKLLIKLGANVCTESNVATVTVNNPQIVSTTPATRCGTGTVILGATGSVGTTLNWYDAVSGGASLASGSSFTTPIISSTTSFYVSADNIGTSASATIGAGSTASIGTYTPFNGSYGGIKTQHLFTAAELTAAGISAGNISSMALDVTVAGTTYNGFYIQMGNTALNTFTSTANIQGGLTTVYTAASVTPTVGINTYSLATPFVWDGVSNIIVSMSWSNGNTYNTSSTIKVDPTTNYSSQSYRADSQTAAFLLAFTGPTVTTGTLTTSLNRPQITFNYTPVCSSPRSAIIATVIAAPTISASATPSTICAGESTTLDASSSNASYIYTWSPSTTPATGASVSATPLLTTTYSITAVDNSGGAYDGCVSSTTVNVTVNPSPSAVTVTPTTASLCAGTIQPLVATGGTIGASGTVAIGNETTLTSSTSQPTAFCNRWKQYWCQMVFTAAELQSAGLTAGDITSLTFDITTLGDAANVTDFRVSLGTIGTSTLTDFSTSGLTQVFGPSTYSHTVGSNLITFTTPYAWDGVSNILVDLRQTGADITNNALTYYTATAGNTVVTAATSSASPDLSTTSPTAVTSNQRLNTVFGFANIVPTTITWLPITNLYTDAAATTAYTGTAATTVYTKPTANVTYTATAASLAGCTNIGTSVITFNALPVVALGIDTTLCGNQDILLDAGNPGSTYLWTPGGQTTQTILVDSVGLGLGAHTISVAVTSTALCAASDAIVVTFDACTGIIENNNGISISIIPNPSNGMTQVVVNGLKSNADLSIYTLEGQLIYQEKVTGNSTTQLDLTNMPTGIYMVRISNETINNLSKLVIQ